MATLFIHDVFPEKILVSREAARQLETRMRELVQAARSAQDAEHEADVVVDFSGVAGVAPSFVDELVGVFETVVNESNGRASRRLVIAHPPTRLSQKFEAVARGRNMSIRALPDGSWLLERAATQSA